MITNTPIMRQMAVISGVGIGKGSAIGKLKFFKRDSRSIRREATTHQEELERLHTALCDACDELDHVYNNVIKDLGEAEAQIFAIHKMLLEDEELIGSAERNIRDGMSAEAAIEATANKYALMFEGMDDAYLSARAADIRDAAQRVVRRLGDSVGEGISRDTEISSNDPYILVADDLSPGETVRLDRSKILGFVTSYGSKNSHTAIIARAMGIPALVDVGEVDASLEGSTAIIDAEIGRLTVNPDLSTLDRFAYNARSAAEDKRRLAAFVGKPSITKSGKAIMLYANIGDEDEVSGAISEDAEGIGLYRTEFLYLNSEKLPDEEKLFNAYKHVVCAMNGRRVIIRTLDIGADKKTDYLGIPNEENPALGYRAIRICLEHTDIFKTQLRAICRASAYGKAAILLPMIVSADEVRKSREILIEVKNELRYEGIPFDNNIELGIMIETPAAAIMSDILAKECDFFSVGTNDLTQYTLAADRQNPLLEELITKNTEPVMRLIAMAAKNIHAASDKKWIGVCGELASNLDITQKFIDIGVDELSVSVPYILRLREKICSCD